MFSGRFCGEWTLYMSVHMYMPLKNHFDNCECPALDPLALYHHSPFRFDVWLTHADLRLFLSNCK